MLLVFAGSRDQWDKALNDSRRAHQLNPNDVLALHVLGYVETVSGNPENGLEYLHHTLRISPRDPIQYSLFNILAQACYLARDYTKAIEYALLGVSEAPKFLGLYGSLAVSYVGLGDIEKAKATVDKARALSPDYLQSRLGGAAPFRKAEHRQRFLTFLRIAAGLEEPGAADALR